jgi:hypothetical protein
MNEQPFLDDFKIQAGKILYISQQLERNHPNLTKLDLSKKKLSDDQVQKICNSARKNTYLKEINLSDNVITDKSSYSLGFMIKKNQGITE